MVGIEVHTLLLRKLGRAGPWLGGGSSPEVCPACGSTHPDEGERAKELLARYAEKGWSLCGALSFAVIDHRSVCARPLASIAASVGQFGDCEVP